MSAKYFRRADRQGRVEKDRRGRDLAALHQVDQIDNQFLGSLHGEGRNKHRALRCGGIAHLAGKVGAPVGGRGRRAIAVAIGGF